MKSEPQRQPRARLKQAITFAAAVMIVGLCACMTLLLGVMKPDTVRNISDPSSLRIFLATITLALGISLVIVGGYRLHWTWTGFGSYTTPKLDGQEFHSGKTLWDWMQLLIVPAVLAGGALLFNDMNAAIQNANTLDNQRQMALQSYIDNMATLMLDKGLSTSKGDAEIWVVARTRTLSVLRTLDGARKGLVLKFLKDSQLIEMYKSTNIDLQDADLSSANLSGANLSGSYLQHIDFTNTNLANSRLGGSDLSYANLGGASLAYANLTNATLEYANLTGADLTNLSLYDAEQGRVDMHYANLTSAILTNADLGKRSATGTHSDLSSAILSHAILIGVNLSGADLSDTDLSYANLTDADLTDADLTGANLSRAVVKLEQLGKAKSLKGATMPDGTKHD
jgi:uncharacterized protein YjbI with pentapeptide repeats